VSAAKAPEMQRAAISPNTQVAKKYFRENS
jgi:hypothetical protein